jgi:hypothetical protein
MDKASVRIRPIRFAFAVDPKNLKDLMRVFEANSVLWGGPYNFILPLFKRVPQRYLDPYRKNIKTRALIDGLMEAFQPDFIVEMEAGSVTGFKFPRRRVINFDQLLSRDERGHCAYGVDLRSIIADLYESTFRFVQRHPPESVVPSCSDTRYDLLFAALFGVLPESGPAGDCAVHYLKALDGKRKAYGPEEYPTLLQQKYLYPFRVANHQLESRRNSWSIDSKLYYMDEKSPLDLVDFWNLRALGWNILPLPASLAPNLTAFCKDFIQKSYRPFPPPSNAYHHASFLCSPTTVQADLLSFMASLRPSSPESAYDAISWSSHIPRIWEEWGRSADHAQPQTITHTTELVDSHTIGDGLHVSTAIPDFLDDDRYASEQHACANVFEAIPGGAQVIPWGTGELTGLIHDFADEKIWVSQEGIVTTAARFSTTRFLRSPSALNVFSAFAKSKGLSLSISPAGNTCEQIIKALGGINLIRIVARSPEFLRFLNSLAHESVEVESDTIPNKKVRKAYAPYAHVLEAVSRATSDGPEIAKHNFFDALISRKILIAGLTLRCEECNHRSWHALNTLAPSMTCPRCSSALVFPAALPPRREEWAYKVSGPFATENFAHGAYCVGSTLHFLIDKILREVTWLPSFRLTAEGGKEAEADFGIFARPSRLSNATSPFLILGECKSFNSFTRDDFTKAHHLADLFPGAVLCFATFRESLTSEEIKAITKIVRRGRSSLRTGKVRNPVLIVTGKELFAQYSFTREFYEVYGDRAEYARMAYLRSDIEELCDFTQQVHLVIESYHSWLDEKRKKRIARLSKPDLSSVVKT